ncbi:MAG: flavin reductase family protein [Armatimonadota bacterium]
MDSSVLHKISYGMYIVGSVSDGKINAQTANAVMQITSEPQAIAASINKQNLTHEYIKESKVFSVSVLSKEAPLKLIGQFGFKSGRDTDKFKDVNYKIGSTGSPIVLDNVIGYIEAKVVNSFDAGSHTVFLAEVAEGEILNSEEPMTYAYYHEVKRGTSPKTAPTYINKEG